VKNQQQKKNIVMTFIMHSNIHS